MNFLNKLSNGDFGLAKTYWVYGVLVGFIMNYHNDYRCSIITFNVFVLYYFYDICSSSNDRLMEII